MNKAGGGDGIPAELFQILKDDAVKVLHSICQQIWKTAVATGLEKVSFHSNPKERQCQRMLKVKSLSCVRLCSPIDCSLPGCKESDTTERLHFHFYGLEKEMVTHSSAFAWRVLGTGEPGGCHLWGCTEADTTEVTQLSFEHSLALPFFGTGMKTDLFPSCGHC